TSSSRTASSTWSTPSFCLSRSRLITKTRSARQRARRNACTKKPSCSSFSFFALREKPSTGSANKPCGGRRRQRQLVAIREEQVGLVHGLVGDGQRVVGIAAGGELTHAAREEHRRHAVTGRAHAGADDLDARLEHRFVEAGRDDEELVAGVADDRVARSKRFG